MLKIKLHWQILIAIILAVVIGLLSGADTVVFGINLQTIYHFFGSLFMNALKMVIVPLIVASIITGIAGIGGAHGLGRMGVKTILYYLTTRLLAILVGLILVNTIAPGIVDGEPIKDLLTVSEKWQVKMRAVLRISFCVCCPRTSYRPPPRVRCWD